jgi:hypothetical protein
MSRLVACGFHSLDNVIVYLNRACFDSQSEDVSNIKVVEQTAGGVTVPLVLLEICANRFGSRFSLRYSRLSLRRNELNTCRSSDSRIT